MAALQTLDLSVRVRILPPQQWPGSSVGLAAPVGFTGGRAFDPHPDYETIFIKFAV